MNLDPRVDRLETAVERIQEQINLLHSGSMQLVTTAFTDMERRLLERIDNQTRNLGVELAKIRESLVPLSEHLALMNKVEQLWDERSKIHGSLATGRLLGAGLGIVVSFLTIWTFLHSNGISLSH